MTLNQKMKQLNPEEKESQRSNELEFYASAASARNCKELFNHGFKTSGEYRIDPDKRYQGQSSFMAYCDFANNLTRISPKEKLTECSNFTSFQSLPVEYSPTTDQMIGLIGHSGSCYQTIDLECTNAPISAGNFWWIDRNGKILLHLAKNESMIFLNYFSWFLGEKRYESNSTRCQCERTTSCELDESCNCFASWKSSWKLRDKGKITADWMLPILGFGYNTPDTAAKTTSELKVNVGDLICSGTSIFVTS